jgi:hypothetical protein
MLNKRFTKFLRALRNADIVSFRSGQMLDRLPEGVNTAGTV